MTNTFIQELNKKTNTKGGVYHESTMGENLNLFSFSGRQASEEEISRLVSRAYAEDKEMLVKNVLYLLDIRGGKGERRMFKIAFKILISLDKELATLVLKTISELGRWDYVFEAVGTELEEQAIRIMAMQINSDITAEHPSLLAKWMPSENTSSKATRELAKKVRILFSKEIGIAVDSRSYRKMLSLLRAKIKIIETNLSQKDYSFDYSKVPSKAMLKYNAAFNRNDANRFANYKASLVKGETKINTAGITPGKIVSEINNKDVAILDAMWKGLNGIDVPEGKNVLVMADVSGSMGSIGWCNESTPIANSVGLAMYFAEKNKGAFKDIFMTFSSTPSLVKIVGKTIKDKFNNISNADWGMSTNIDAAFKKILNATLVSGIKEDLPSHLIIVSDMEFDAAGGKETNFEKWTREYAEHGLVLPKIIFWNVALTTRGFPVTKYTENVAMISGYAPNVSGNLFTMGNMTPTSVMIDTLSKYDKYL